MAKGNAEKISEYITLPCVFDDFIELPKLADDEIELVCIKRKPAIPEIKYVPSYVFEIRRNGIRIGEIGLRIGYTEGLYYGGNIGYAVDGPYRGHGYAAKGCRLLVPVMKAHGMKKVVITNEQHNIPSMRTCEKIGARLIDVVKLPAWTSLYQEGQRYVNIYEWSFE
ncbi:MAG: GNAT family N-acetyltransferase [Clostridia bacterium]